MTTNKKPITIRLPLSACLSIRIILFLFFNLFVITTCVKQHDIEPEITEIEEPAAEIDPDYLRVREIVLGMDERLLAAQVLISGIDGAGNLANNTIDLLTEIPTGGIMLFKYNLNIDNDSIRNMLTQTKAVISAESKVEPFICVDHEGGTVNRFQSGVLSLPSAITYWEFSKDAGMEAALVKIENDSFKDAVVLNSLGINMNLAPIAENLNDDNRVFLSRRSYGPNPVFVSLACNAFIMGMEKAGVLCVVKHFPGSAGADPHYSKSILNLKGGELDELVLPFSYLIKNGTRAIMAAHTFIPALDSEIATLSPVVMRNWLRDGLGFDGIIISDDFIMAAAGGLPPEAAAVKSLSAGSDMILVWPRDLKKTHSAIITALENETLSRERLEDAAHRIIYRKLKMGITQR